MLEFWLVSEGTLLCTQKPLHSVKLWWLNAESVKVILKGILPEMAWYAFSFYFAMEPLPICSCILLDPIIIIINIIVCEIISSTWIGGIIRVCILHFIAIVSTSFFRMSPICKIKWQMQNEIASIKIYYLIHKTF